MMDELMQMKIDRIHSDIMNLHLTLLIRELHETNKITDDDYATALNKIHNILTTQISNYAESIMKIDPH